MLIYLAPHYLKDGLIDHLTYDKKVLLEVKIMSPKTYIETKIDHKENVFTLKAKIEKLALDELKDAAFEYSFLNKAINDRKLLDLYDIDIEKLEINAEYKAILKLVEPYPKKAIDKMIEDDENKIEIISAPYDDVDRYIIARYIAKGAMYLAIPSPLNLCLKNIKTTNIQKAIESIGQDIIRRGLDLKKVAIQASVSDFDLVALHLKKMGIKTSFYKPYRQSIKAKTFISIIRLYQDFNIANYIELVMHDLYQSGKALKTYLKDHLDVMTVDHLDRFKDRNDYYRELEMKADVDHMRYVPLLRKIKEAKDIKDALLIAFDAINDGSEEVKKIKDTLEKDRQYIEKDIELVIEALDELKIDDKGDGVIVFDYDQTLVRPFHLYVLDPNTNKYPAFKDMQGFINEEILKDTAFTPLTERFERYMEHFYIYHSSFDTTFVYLESTLDGKKVEYDARFDVPKSSEDEDDDIRPFVYDRRLKDPSIFFDDDILSGSITSFERYFDCPYKYFIERGIGLKEPIKKEIGPGLIGTIYHAVLEKLTTIYKKDYPKADQKAIRDIVEDELADLYTIYPQKKYLLDVIRDKIYDSIVLELVFLASMEMATDYIPTDFEKKISGMIIDEKDHKVKLKTGYIDRYDTKDDLFRIIDYKTYDKSISQTDIAKGKALQLLTYTIILAQTIEKRPACALYIITKHDPLRITDYTFARTKGLNEVVVDDEKILDEFIKAHKMNGLIFEDDDQIDEGYRHLSKGKHNSGAFVDLIGAKELLYDVYRKLYDRLKAGDIALMPKDGACKYCNFKGICHFKGVMGLNDELISDIEIGRKKNATE